MNFITSNKKREQHFEDLIKPKYNPDFWLLLIKNHGIRTLDWLQRRNLILGYFCSSYCSLYSYYSRTKEGGSVNIFTVSKWKYTKSNSFDVRQTIFNDNTLVKNVERVLVCLNKISCGPCSCNNWIML